MATEMTEDQLRVYGAVNQKIPVHNGSPKFDYTAFDTARWLLENVGVLIGRNTYGPYYLYDGQVYYILSHTQIQWCGNIFQFADDVVKGAKTTHDTFRKANNFPFGREEERDEYKTQK